jgi:hypothetical protein
MATAQVQSLASLPLCLEATLRDETLLSYIVLCHLFFVIYFPFIEVNSHNINITILTWYPFA